MPTGFKPDTNTAFQSYYQLPNNKYETYGGIEDDVY